MKKPVLVLLALLVLLPFAQLMAQTPSAAVPPAKSATAPAPDLAQFLATLSDGQSQAPKAPTDRVPTPLFMTGCNTTGCPAGQICCFLCGNPPEGDDSGCWGCVTPRKPRGCPLVV
ncbi:MAG TPA: hypothetical protein VF173_27360 [Thermoanaerobaculia bacterium]|nr:hypothetical protein [Thermoanaerobaculia bacterium]